MHFRFGQFYECTEHGRTRQVMVLHTRDDGEEALLRHIDTRVEEWTRNSTKRDGDGPRPPSPARNTTTLTTASHGLPTTPSGTSEVACGFTLREAGAKAIQAGDFGRAGLAAAFIQSCASGCRLAALRLKKAERIRAPLHPISRDE